ncbi:phage portal protein [Bradyrhizobium sp. SZCCHNR1020]|uniref:phage portal protein n=1 Tax=Bradyrhizobium sp. SZCCHNR1020 TaxID=3057343 RepID=UPI002916FC45|nr:phage portal protein [Bradyrhizobium sp. SZCCHNR1020]
MGILDRLLGLMRERDDRVASGGKTRSDPNLDSLLWGSSLYTTQSVTGVAINQFTALNATAVMAAVTILAEDVAKLPWSLYQNAEGEGRREFQNHYLYDLLQEPNDYMNGLEFREMMQVALALRGNAYAPIIRDGRARPIELIPVNPDWCQMWEAPTGELFYRVTPNGLHAMAKLRSLPSLIPAADMLHIRGFSSNGLLGASRIVLAREAIALSIAQEQQAARWMGNGAQPSGILTTDQKLGDAAAKRMAQDWKNMHSGLANSGKTAVFEQGLKFEKLSMTTADLDFINSRKFQLEEVARIFRVPLYMLGVTVGETKGNLAQKGQEYVNYTLTGYTNRWAAKYSQTFGLRRDRLSVGFDFRALTEADISSRINDWRIAIMSMIATPDEARIDLGMRPQGGEAAKLHFPQNMAAAGSQSTGTQADEGGRTPEDAPQPLSKARRRSRTLRTRADTAPRPDVIAATQRMRAAAGASWARS